MDKFKFLPKTTGVYLLCNKNQILYIGKAINIKSRVKNHFQQPSCRDNFFINKINKIKFIETSSEIEALILEANLIKKHQPKYNVIWKDDKSFLWVAVEENKQKIPYIYITHHPRKFEARSTKFETNSKSKIQNTKHVSDFGFRISDFPARYIGPFTDSTALKKTLRFLRRVFPYYTSAKHPKNKCTWCHLDLCPGPNPNLTKYKKNIKKLILVLQGKKTAVLIALQKEMKKFAKEKKFEEAGKIRDQVYALQQIMAHAHVINNEIAGRPTSLRTSDVPITLAKIIGLKKRLHKIEAYDVSNIQGKQATGSMVVFSAKGGQSSGWIPDKSQYKKFKIKLTEKPNDIAMLKEILQRRFKHPEWEYPEVILIDGGKAQLNAALSVIPGLTRNPGVSADTLDSRFRGNDIRVISIAKGRQDPLRSEARLFVEGRCKPISLKSLPQEVYNLIKHLDDEAHRFAITYHKKLRSKELLN